MTVFTTQLGQEIQVGYPRFSPFSFYFLSVLILRLPLMMIFIALTMIFFSAVFCRQTTCRPETQLGQRFGSQQTIEVGDIYK